MDVSFSPEQEVLRASARDFLERECPMSLTREQMDDAVGLPEGLWTEMAGLGWLGLIVPETHGGSGLGWIEVALLQEELGRVLCPAPFLSTAVVGASAILLGASPLQKQRWLPELAQGRLRIALAQLEDEASFRPEAITLAATRDGDGLRLNGRKRFVVDAASAGLLIVPVRTRASGAATGDGLTLAVVRTDAPGVTRTPVRFNEPIRKRSEILFEDVSVDAGHILGPIDQGWPILARVIDGARTALCAEACGGAQKVLEMSVEYIRTREQFGQPIGRFQALQHKAADMLVGVEGIRSASYYAAWAMQEQEPDVSTTASLAASYSTETYRKVAGAGIQLHGGLGFTWEQDLHLYYKHAQAAELAFGSPSELRAEAADVLMGPALSAAGPTPASR